VCEHACLREASSSGRVLKIGEGLSTDGLERWQNIRWGFVGAPDKIDDDSQGTARPGLSPFDLFLALFVGDDHSCPRTREHMVKIFGLVGTIDGNSDRA